MSRPAPPTRRQRECLTVMGRHFLTFGEWPTVTELASELDIHIYAVAGHLRALQRKGLAVNLNGGRVSSRSWRPAGWERFIRPAARRLLKQLESIPCLPSQPPDPKPLTTV